MLCRNGVVIWSLNIKTTKSKIDTNLSTKMNPEKRMRNQKRKIERTRPIEMFLQWHAGFASCSFLSPVSLAGSVAFAPHTEATEDPMIVSGAGVPRADVGEKDAVLGRLDFSPMGLGVERKELQGWRK